MTTIETIEPNVDRIVWEDREIILVGTAHISQASVDLARRIITEQKPDAVAVELCASRFDSLKDPNRWRNTDILQIFKEGKMYVLLTQLLLASHQKKMGDSLNVKPGAEMMEAVAAAEELSIPLVLADRDVKTTLRRAWANTKVSSLFKLFFVSLYESFKDLFTSIWHRILRKDVPEKKSVTFAEEIEKLKEADALDNMLKEFAIALPDIKKPLIDERDLYLASKIREGVPAGKKIVAILGAGHIPGIKKIIDSPIDRTALGIIPPATKTSKFLGIIFPLILTILFIAGFFYGGSSTTLSMATTWILYTGVAAAIGATAALAHPASILAAGISAPITTLHPLLAAGWISGLVEAWIRRPQVKDLETVLDDLGSIKTIYKNRVTRIFLVMILTNLATSVGMIWGAKVVASLL